jgi:hypothetical protein
MGFASWLVEEAAGVAHISAPAPLVGTEAWSYDARFLSGQRL